MAKPLTVANLDIELKSLVDWEIFGIHLRGIPHNEIEKITRDKPTTDERKLALYSKWHSVCPNPSWSDVAIALEKAQEIALAEKVSLYHIHTENSQKMVKAKIMLSAEPEEDTIINTLDKLDKTFDQILIQAYECIETMVDKKMNPMHNVIFKLKIALKRVRNQDLQKCFSIGDIFEILKECTHFLDGSILKAVIETVIGESKLLNNINEHIEKVKQFKSLSPIKELKGKLQNFTQAKFQDSQALVIIKLNNDWGDFQLGLVEALAKKLTRCNEEAILIKIEPGSIQITIALPTDNETEIIDNCSQQLQLAQLMGVIMIQIGSHPAVVNVPENNNADYTFERAILEASTVGNIEAVQLLLEMGIDADHTDEQGQTPLIIASENGHENIVKHLLTTTGVNINVNKQDNSGRTAVMVAKTTDIYQTLVQADADTNIITHDGLTQLMVSCLHGNHEVANHLLFTLKHNVTIASPDEITLLMAASQGGNHKIVEHLLSTGHDPNTHDSNGNTAINLSCLNGHYTVTKTLLNHNANPNISNKNGWTPLISASYKGNYKIVELLLLNEVDSNVANKKSGQTALMNASQNGHNEAVKVLLQKRATCKSSIQDQDNKGKTAIYWSCFNGHYSVIETLLKHNANPNVSDNDGWTPLMVASQEGHHKLVQLLINTTGNNLMTRNVLNGITALMLASMNGHQKIAELLLAKGHDPNVRSKNGSTAIKYACVNNHYSLAECLLKYKADHNIPDSAGWTPMMYASQKSYPKIVLLLIQHEVNPNSANCETRTFL